MGSEAPAAFSYHRESFSSAADKELKLYTWNCLWAKYVLCKPLVISLSWPVSVVCFLGKVILASTKAVYVLVPLPLERQIQDLLASHRVEEALILTEGAQQNIPKDKFQVTRKKMCVCVIHGSYNDTGITNNQW